MANIRKRGDKWQVQVRRIGVTPLVKSFLSKERRGSMGETQRDPGRLS